MAVTVGPTLEEHVYRAGLLALKCALGDEELLSFPRRPNGTPLLLRQSFFERVLGGSLDLASFAAGDVIAAQADVRNLSLPQLLHLRCAGLESGAAAPSSRAQSDFLTTVDEHLEKRIAAKLTAEGAAKALAGQAADLVRLVLLVYGVHERLDREAVGSSEHWLVRLGDVQAVLLLPACELLEPEPLAEAPVYCHRNLSRASVAVSRTKKQLHWEVELSSPSAFASAAAKSPPARRARVSTGRPSISRCPREDSPAKGGGLAADPEVAALIRERAAEAVSAAEALRGELAAAKAGAEEELAAAKARADEELAAARARAEEELAAVRAKADEELSAAKARADELDVRCQELAAWREAAEGSQAAAAKELEALRSRVEPLKEELAKATAAKAKTSEELSATKARLTEAKDAEGKIALKANGYRQQLSFSRQAEETLAAQLDALREELAVAKQQNCDLTQEVETLRGGSREAKLAEAEAVPPPRVGEAVVEVAPIPCVEAANVEAATAAEAEAAAPPRAEAAEAAPPAPCAEAEAVPASPAEASEAAAPEPCAETVPAPADTVARAEAEAVPAALEEASKAAAPAPCAETAPAPAEAATGAEVEVVLTPRTETTSAEVSAGVEAKASTLGPTERSSDFEGEVDVKVQM